MAEQISLDEQKFDPKWARASFAFYGQKTNANEVGSFVSVDDPLMNDQLAWHNAVGSLIMNE